MRLIFVLQFDSFIRNLVPVIKRLVSEGHDCTVILYRPKLSRQWITHEILQIIGDVPFHIMTLSQIKRELKSNYEVLVIGSVGGRFIVSLSKYLQGKGLKTRIATGYIGALLNNYPKGFLKGVRRRSNTHLIWTPGKEAAQTIEQTGLVDQQKTRIAPTGLPVIDHLYELTCQHKTNPEKVILFIEQPTYPRTRDERRILVGQLIDLAKAYPRYRVVIKPRFSRKVSHTHRPKYLLSDILEEYKDRPRNISISNDRIYELFKQTKFAITVSSTGGLEAMLFGIPTYFINDFCQGQNQYGTDYFKATGAVVSIQDLIRKQYPVLNFEAVKEKLRFDGNNTQRLADELSYLAETIKS